MIVIELIIIIITALVIFSVGYEIGRDAGIDVGVKRTYDGWAMRIGKTDVWNDYVQEDVPLPTRVDETKWKPKRKTKRFNKADKLKYYFGDLCRVKHRKKRFPKCEINKMLKELEKQLREEGKLDD